MNTLQNTCFQFQDNDEASKECFRVMRLKCNSQKKVVDKDFCWMSLVGTMQVSPINRFELKVIPATQYTSLLQSDQPKQLTVEDLKVGNEFKCIEKYSYDKFMIYANLGEVYKCYKNGYIKLEHDRQVSPTTGILNRHFILHSSQPKIETERRNVPCRNCNELLIECACKRNKCIECGTTVGNTTFTVCDSCWDILETKRINKIVPVQEEVKCGGGHYYCEKCGETVFGSSVHVCEQENITVEPKKKSIKAKPHFYSVCLLGMQEISKEYGYNLIVHGSMNRDMDLVAVAWTDNPKPHLELIHALCEYLGVFKHEKAEEFMYRVLPGDRDSYVINLNRGSKFNSYLDEQYYLDISFTPQTAHLQQQLKEAKELLEESFPVIQSASTLLRVAPNNNTLPEPPHDVIKLAKSITQFLTRNK